jgi:hypothetical protein
VNNCGACAKACAGLSAACSGSACATASTLATQGAPFDIIDDGVNLYWTDNFNGTVSQMPIGGGTVTTLASGRNAPGGITTDGVKVYWAEWGTAGNGYTDGDIASVPIGSTTVTVLATGQSGPGHVAVDSANIYWTNQGSAAASFTDGSLATTSLATPGTVTKLVTGLLLPQSLVGAAAAAGGTTFATLYWTNYGSTANSYSDGSIESLAVGTAGATPVVVATSQAGAMGLTGGVLSTGDLYLFWTNFVGNAVEGVDATANQVFEVATNQSSPWGILLGADGLYWTNSGSGTVMKLVFIGTTPATLAVGQNAPAALTGDATAGANLFWANDGTTGADGTIVSSKP